MNKKTEYILIIFIIFLALFARFFFWSEGKYGPDFFYHYTIVEHSIEKGYLETKNDMALCYEGVTAGQPIGYYAPPYYLAKIIGIENSFWIISAILGISSLLLAYILLKLIFNRKVALLTILFTAISLAQVSKSYPFIYRGDNIIYPLLILSLIFLYKCLSEDVKKKKITYALLAGATSASSIVFWSGYPLVIIIYFTCLFFYLLYEYIKKKDIINNIKFSSINILSQVIIFYILFFILELQGKALIFAKEYYPFLILFSFALLGALYISQKKKTHIPLILYICLIIVASLFTLNKIYNIYTGFGSIHTENSLELIPTSFYIFYLMFSILLLSSLAGIYYYLKKFNNKKAFFLGLLIPSLYLVFSASRYTYIASIPIITLTGVFLDNKKIIRKKFELFKFIIIILVIFMFIWMFYAFPLFFTPRTSQSLTNAYLFIKDNSPEEACIISFPDPGEMAEFFAKRYYYFSSLGMTEERTTEVATFLLTNQKASFKHTNKSYILLVNTDLILIPDLNKRINISDIEFEPAVIRLYNNTLIAPNSRYTFHIIQEDDNIKIIKVSNGTFNELRHYFKDGKMYDNKEGEGCIYAIDEKYMYFNDKLCNSNIYKMITGQEIKGLEKIYDKNNIVVYKQITYF